ncbi:Y4bD/Y4pK family protein [Burkholderia contaminans]|uniref:Y4bD/Y4pK family protein n=1 Tax=Burkholderia contaminans TaxID=488447 RepID=UPI0021AB28C6|nr:Y4bD/Y4pK family protein [Burkholderia contaminans]
MLRIGCSTDVRNDAIREDLALPHLDSLSRLPEAGQPGRRTEALRVHRVSRGSRPYRYRKSATACRDDGCATVTVKITHPFHPRCGTLIQLATRRINWGEDRVMFYDEHDQLVSILASWTDVDEPDAFAQAAAGRSAFRVDDLRRLRALIDDLRPEVLGRVK